MRTKFSFPLWTWSLFSSLLKTCFRRCRRPFILRSLFHHLAPRATPTPPPPPPMLTGSLLLSYSLLTRFFWRWLRAWHRLCCGGLTPLFPLPRQLDNGQARESYAKCCKAIGLGTKNTSVDRHELGPKKKYRSRFILNKYRCNSASTVENVALKLVDWTEWNQA